MSLARARRRTRRARGRKKEEGRRKRGERKKRPCFAHTRCILEDFLLNSKVSLAKPSFKLKPKQAQSMLRVDEV